MRTLHDFTNLYSLQKTLRFELKPIGKTLEHIEKKGLLKADEIRANDYKSVKKIIDRTHKAFIDEALESIYDKKSKTKDQAAQDTIEAKIEEFASIYQISEKSEQDKQELSRLSTDLRKLIVSVLTGKFNQGIKEKFEALFGEELIKEKILDYCENEEETEQVRSFARFTTYFKGFHENRKNIYSDEEKSTAISFRLVHQNLPKFLDNLKIVKKIQTDHNDFPWMELNKNFKKIHPALKIDDYFQVKGFLTTISQTGIQSYNDMLGGKSVESGTKIQGLNELTNLYRQKHDIERKKLPNLKPLYKQILSDRSTLSFVPEAFKNDQSVLDAIGEFCNELFFNKNGDNPKGLADTLIELFTSFEANNMEQIYLSNDLGLTNLSAFLFNDWSFIRRALAYDFDQRNISEKPSKKLEMERERWSKQKYYSIDIINRAAKAYSDQLEERIKTTPLENFFSNLSAIDENRKEYKLLDMLQTRYVEAKSLLENDYPPEKNLKEKKDGEIEKIKNLLDSIKSIQSFLRIFLPAVILDEKDLDFYNRLEDVYDNLSGIIPLYNKVRNYLTGKVYSEEKFKLNFENSTLLDGWDENKESSNLSVLFQKDGLFYLGVINKDKTNILSKLPQVTGEEEYIEKMIYKLLPGPNKMLPKVFFSAKNIAEYAPSDKILEIRKSESFKKGETFNLKDCHAIIDFYKESIEAHPDWSKFGFRFSNTKSYEDISGFYREVEAQGYKLHFQKVPKSFIDNLVDEGKLFLFQIYNKDFSSYSKGKPNLHTIYFKSLFSDENLKDVCLKLNGEAEIFYRKKSIHYDEKILRNGHHAKELADKFAYPIIKDKRFSEDKFQFHVPITLNFKAKTAFNFNLEVRKYLKNNKNANIIGIDRGERHLLYLVLINQKGEILKQLSLNKIKNSDSFPEIDYQSKLQLKEQDRDKARKDWGRVENIKELKEGYLSHIIHEIAKWMIEYNAIVVLEDLNMGFKRGRQKVERQVYQKFEKMLIDKMNFLVFKDTLPKEAGGILKAYQLTDGFQSFEKLGKQSGFLFYVPAWNTSKIDPYTGFVNFLDVNYENQEKAKIFLSKFDSIKFNQKQDWFEFKIQSQNFLPGDNAPENKEWVVCTTNEVRYSLTRTANQSFSYSEVNVTSKLKQLFEIIPYQDGADFKLEILKKDDPRFFKDLIYLLKVTLSLRHNNGKKGDEEKDFILSPIANSRGKFFNSIRATDFEPKDADANGAYHIALKGLLNLQVINETTDDNLKKPDWKIKNKDWLNFVWNRNP